MCNKRLLLHFKKRHFSQCLCGLWHMLHFERGYRQMATQNEVLERAFQAIDELLGRSVKAEQPTRPERSNLPLVPPETDNFLADVALETACRCSRWPFPHLHSREHRERAIREWNRDSRHKVERIQ